MTNRLTHAEFKKILLHDPEVKQAYEDLEEEFQLLQEMLRARENAELTQAQVAKLMNTSASAVSRLESLPTSNKPSPSLATIIKYVHALDCRLEIKIVPRLKRAAYR